VHWVFTAVLILAAVGATAGAGHLLRRAFAAATPAAGTPEPAPEPVR
jgi:hypothetical protein